MISIALVDDHIIFLDALEKYLDKIPNFQTVFKCTSGEQLIKYLEGNESNKVDIVLLDIKMRGMSGIDCLEVIADRFKNIKVIMVSMFNDQSFIDKAIEKGAMSFIPKDIDSEVLVKAINSVHQNGYYAYEELSKHLVDNLEYSFSQKIIEDPINRITKSELEILVYLCQGFSASEIGASIFKSARTVEGYKQKLLDKTQLKNTASLVAWAFRKGIVY